MNQQSNIITFYNQNNICNGDNKSFSIGKYNNTVFNNTWKPKLAKINANTMLTIYFGSVDKQYINSYNDRFVVVQIPDAQITSFEIKNYIHVVKPLDDMGGIYLSTSDIIVIMLFFIILYFWHK
jgi:hypothetical protein